MEIFFDTQFNKEHVIIKSGEIYASKTDQIISTILGSCVAVCIYDTINKISGMNHFLMATRGPQKNISNSPHKDMGRYGDEATPLLIEKLLNMGAKQKRLQAEFFGAASLLHCCQNSISKSNMDIAQNILQQYDIPIVYSNVGGKKGRKVFLDTQSGKITLEYMPRLTKLTQFPDTTQKQVRCLMSPEQLCSSTPPH